MRKEAFKIKLKLENGQALNFPPEQKIANNGSFHLDLLNPDRFRKYQNQMNRPIVAIYQMDFLKDY